MMVSDFSLCFPVLVQAIYYSMSHVQVLKKLHVAVRCVLPNCMGFLIVENVSFCRWT